MLEREREEEGGRERERMLEKEGEERKGGRESVAGDRRWGERGKRGNLGRGDFGEGYKIE